MRALRGQWPKLKRLLLAFGLFGLAIWPAAAWLGYDLISDEVARFERYPGLHVNASTIVGRDFVNIWHGGREALDGAEGIYDRTEYRRTLRASVDVWGIYAFSYPPHMLMLSVPFGVPPYLWSLTLWLIATFGLFTWAARPWLRQAGLPLWSVLLLPGAVVNLWAGHFGYMIGGLALYGWWHAGRRPALSGAAFALMSVKPHMGVLVPLILAAKREWSTISCATLGTLALVLASTVAFGIDAWTTWLTSTLSFQVGLIDPGAQREYYYMMPTVARMLLSIDRDGPVLLGQILFGVTTLALLIWAERRHATLADLGLLSIAATPLILPYLFNYDLVALSLAALVWAARSPARWWSPERLAYGAMFVVPLAQAPLAREGYWLSPVAIVAALAFAAWRAGRDWAEEPE
jgi:alpha-1,2-mannosyltransferase